MHCFTFAPEGPFSLWPRPTSLPMLPAMRVFPVGGSMFYGLPDRPAPTPPSERDRPGSARTKYVEPTDPESYARETTRHRLADYTRLAGLLGYVAMPSRAYTVNAGRPTRNVPNNASGMPPATIGESLGRAIAEHMLLNDGELRHLRRYRYASKGSKFAESMEREQRERDLAYWREALPYWPLTKSGEFAVGMPYAGTVVFHDGTTLRERIKAWQETHSDEVEESARKTARMRRDEEIRKLEEEQRAEMRADRLMSKRVRNREGDESPRPVRFR